MARYGGKAAKGDKIAAYIAVKEGLLPYGALKRNLSVGEINNIIR